VAARLNAELHVPKEIITRSIPDITSGINEVKKIFFLFSLNGISTNSALPMQTWWTLPLD
jgi:hypothetical protein